MYFKFNDTTEIGEVNKSPKILRENVAGCFVASYFAEL